MEVEASSALEPSEQWVSESRLVPTEVWEEEPVERLEHRTVTEQRSVPQVKTHTSPLTPPHNPTDLYPTTLLTSTAQVSTRLYQ